MDIVSMSQVLEARPSPTRVRANTRYAWPAAICGITGLLALFGLGAKSIWTDEAFSEAMARLHPITMWHAIIRGDAVNGFYYSLLHLWQFGGNSEAWLRFPSVAFGVLAAWALFALNRRLLGTRVAVISGVLLAVNTFFVYYEQDARPYSLVVFLVVLATYLFVMALERPSMWRWVGYGVVSALAIYAHLFAAFVVVAHLLMLAVRHRRPRLRDALAGYGLTVLLVAPLVAVVVRTDPLQRRFIDAVHLGSFRWLFLNLTGAGGVPSGGGTFLLAAYFAMCCFAVLWMARAVIRRREEEAERRWTYGLVLSWLAVPILGSFVTSLVRSPIFYPRYLIVALPALVTMAGIGIGGFRHRSFQVIATGVLVALSIHPLLSYYGNSFKQGEDWRPAVAYVTGAERPGDGIVFLSRYGRRPFEYYLRRLNMGADLTPIYPSMPWGQYVPIFADMHAGSTTTAAARLQGGYQRVWVVLLWEGLQSVDENAGPLRSVLRSSYQDEAERAFGGELEVRLYRRISG
jgi:mannosyltransferase